MSLLRASLTLLAGGAVAQLGPFLFGPLLTRLYSPEVFGLFHLASAVAANVAVVACARYEFALPLARTEAEAAALRALCARVLALTTGLCAVGAAAAALWLGDLWPLWIPLMAGSLGALSLATLEATRLQRVQPLAWSRILQFWGGGAVQAGAGWMHAGVSGLLMGPAVAAAAAWALLRGSHAAVPPAEAAPDWRAAARQHADFPRLNAPHAFLGALQDTAAVALVAAFAGPAAAGAWGLALRYLKAPATLVGASVSQALYPRLAQARDTRGKPTVGGRAELRRLLVVLAAGGAALAALLGAAAPPLFVWAFGTDWRPAGDLARALALYIGLHFVVSPLSVVTLAWNAQAWALRVALVGQALFLAGLGAGLWWGGLTAAGWAISVMMALYFGWFLMRLWTWPVSAEAPA